MIMSMPHYVLTHMFDKLEQYITRVGLLRKTSLDELPQIFNIWMGQMSIIGDSEIIGTNRKSLDFTRALAA